MTRSDVPAICERVRILLERPNVTAIVCNLGPGLDVDIDVIEALARIRLTARRLGCRVQLEGVSSELHELVAFTGLTEALGLEPCGQTEEREERLGFEEESELGDAAVCDLDDL